MRRSFLASVVLFIGVAFIAPAAAQSVVEWIVVVPTNYTVTHQTDSGLTRIDVLDVLNGVGIFPWNFRNYDELNVIKDPLVNPLIKICNNTGSPETFRFFDTDASGECPSDPANFIEVTIDPGECYEDEGADCAQAVEEE